MANTFLLQDSAKAMRSYAQGMLATDPHTHRAKPWRRQYVRGIENERETIRVAEAGGGMCHLVSEWLWDKHGWVRVPVSYLDCQGRVICAGHLINVLPDGSLLDATADQFGEGRSVRRLAPNEDDYGRYRPEFDEDFNPTSYDCVRAFFWSGVPDTDAQDKRRTKHGEGWWLADKSAYAAYLQHQVDLGGEYYAGTLKRLKRSQAAKR